LFFVIGKLHVMWLKTPCPEEAYLNRWAKRRLNNKNNRQKHDIVCLKYTVARLKSKDVVPKQFSGRQTSKLKCCSFCYSCCYFVAFATRFQIKQIN